MPATAPSLRRFDISGMSDFCEHYRWLLGPQGAEWLRRAADETGRPLSQLERLRKAIGVERARLVAEQIELRRRAVAKFAQAEHLFFTRQGLEQASDCWVAAYKARRFPPGPVADLCAGIGGDLLALAARGPVIGVEIDPIRARLAAANLRSGSRQAPTTPANSGRAQLGSTSLVVIEDAQHFPVAHVEAWHMDPDRRPGGRRTVRLDFSQPRLAVIEALRAAQPSAAIKLAPACPLPESWHRQAELEWIGRQGQCRQLVAWFGRLAEHPGKRRATLIDGTMPDGFVIRTLVGDRDCRAEVASRLGRYIFEPDAAVLAAGLASTLAAEHGLAFLAASSTYLTADHPVVADRALACFEVCDAMPFDLRRVRQALRARCIGRLEIKTRGLSLDPDGLRHKLGLGGPNAAVLLIARCGRSALAILARRLAPSSPSP